MKKNQQFFHDIEVDTHMLQTQTIEDVVSHLYMMEAYYFNPKQIKRPQLVRLVSMLQEKVRTGIQPNINVQDSNQQPERHLSEVDKAREARRRNFFEKKRMPYADAGNQENGPENEARPAG